MAVVAAAPIIAAEAPPARARTVLVGPSRVRWGAFAVLTGVFGAVAAVKATLAGETAGALAGVVVCAATLAVCARLMATRRSLLVFDDYGFTDCRSGRVVPWGAVDTIRSTTHHGPFGSVHVLHLVLAPGVDDPRDAPLLSATLADAEGEIAVALGGLALTPENLVAAIELRSGLPVRRVQATRFPGR